MNKSKKRHRVFFMFVLISLIASVVYTIVCVITAPSVPEGNAEGQRVKSDYILMLQQCSLGIVAMFLPTFLEKKFSIDVPAGMLILYVTFLYAAIYLGEVRSFYYRVPHWDTILHTFSGAMLGALGFSVVDIFNRHEKVPVELSLLFLSAFAFCFAVTLGVIWEIYEFVGDSILGLNMQKFMLESGEKLLGQAALADTMKDLMVDALGAFSICVVGYFSLKLRKNWLGGLMVNIEEQ